jgi:hypothetical protein
VKTLLDEARRQLHTILQDKFMMTETPLEVRTALESAADSLDAAVRRLKAVASPKAAAAPLPGGPTRQQGQLPPVRTHRHRDTA